MVRAGRRKIRGGAQVKLILLSGGSGKRLWPLSNDARSKQFLRVLDDGQGRKESMVQRIWRQLGEAGLDGDAYVAASRAQSEMLEFQLGQGIRVIVEPERRDTFPAIALSVLYLIEHEKADPDETVLVMPVDSYVEQAYFMLFGKLDKLIQSSLADIGLIGAKPASPSEKYGYILPGVRLDFDAFAVERFVEKPKSEEARRLIDEHGALWNCGVFAFRPRYLLDVLAGRQYPVRYTELQERYGGLPVISFDYEVVEQADRVGVVPYNGEWKDLGTWNTLTEELTEPVIGNAVLDDQSRGSHVINELSLPVKVLGIPNAVVAVCPDGVLVADKAATPRLKELLDDGPGRPMYEERRWGWTRVLDFMTNEKGWEVLTKRICVQAGRSLRYQTHHRRSEIWTIISGAGEVVLDGAIRSVGPGDVVVIRPGVKHALRAFTPVELIEVQMGEVLVEEDIIREDFAWPPAPPHNS